MPETNATPSSTDSFRRERFWYDGHYYMYGIQHKFNDGQFTQDLHLLALPNESLLDLKQQMEITECGGPKKKGAEGEASESSVDPAAKGPTEAQVQMSEAIEAAAKAREIIGNPLF